MDRDVEQCLRYLGTQFTCMLISETKEERYVLNLKEEEGHVTHGGRQRANRRSERTREQFTHAAKSPCTRLQPRRAVPMPEWPKRRTLTSACPSNMQLSAQCTADLFPRGSRDWPAVPTQPQRARCPTAGPSLPARCGCMRCGPTHEAISKATRRRRRPIPKPPRSRQFHAPRPTAPRRPRHIGAKRAVGSEAERPSYRRPV